MNEINYIIRFGTIRLDTCIYVYVCMYINMYIFIASGKQFRYTIHVDVQI